MFAHELRDLRFDFLLHARCERLSVEHTCRHTEMISLRGLTCAYDLLSPADAS